MGDDGDQDIKRKEASASEGGDTSKGLLLATKSTAEAQPEPLVASEAGGSDRDLNGKEARRPWEEEGGILRLKKEADAAWDLWFLTQSSRRRKATQEKALQASEAGKKRKKVVKIKLRKEYVDYMAACPFTICEDLSDGKLAQPQYTPAFRHVHAAGKFLEAKNREYWNALIAQQEELGYAEDEKEVTDDEEEEVVKS